MTKLDRRTFMASAGAMTLAMALTRAASGQSRQSLVVEAKPTEIALGTGRPKAQIWTPSPSINPPRFRTGEIELTFRNALPVPASLDWRGLDGAGAAEPLTSRPAIPAGEVATLTLPLRRPGTFLAELRLLAGSQTVPQSGSFPLVVEERAPVAVDQDEVLLIEGWRPALGAGPSRGGDAITVFTVNGQILPELSIPSGARLRLRFINGCQRQVIAVKLPELALRVIALDSAPAEAFMARNNAVVLAPGGRVDALIDVPDGFANAVSVMLHDGRSAEPVARLLPSRQLPIRPNPLPPAASLPVEGLPSLIELKTAQRISIDLGSAEWVSPAASSTAQAPAFKVRVGRSVVLTLNNPGTTATSFHIHGHHFRHLDRMDDGWKPYWLDTLVIEPGQAQRIAFVATYKGRWLVESVATQWGSPRLVRWFVTE